jgi:PAS domain S-box-containing protein
VNILTEVQGKNPLILVVEDEQIVALDITRTLNQLGYQVLPTVDTGEEALEYLKTIQPDLILMDIKLKGRLDGIETAQKIRDRYSIPLIFLSTFSDDQTLSRAKMTEPYGYITKSSHRNDLHSMIEMALYRHKMELKAQKSEELLSVTLKSISDAVIGAGLDGTILTWNSGARQIFGYSEDEVRGKNLSILTPPFYPNEMPDILERIKKENEVEHYETVRQRKNGEIINISLKVSPIRGPLNEITGVSLIARDITAKKRLEREILEISERERRRIGKDLHDSLGQNLTGVLLQLKVLENSLREKGLEEEVETTRKIEKMTAASIEETRNLAKNLLTVSLQNQGLSVALSELAAQSESISSMKIECRTDIEEDITDEVIAGQLYHIVQEALTNAIRHGNAGRVWIELTEDDSEYTIRVHDDGKGFNREKLSFGLGLKIMEYRSNMINGRLSIFSDGRNGTIVSCRVPKFQVRDAE